jgi:hypothetical protein
MDAKGSSKMLIYKTSERYSNFPAQPDYRHVAVAPLRKPPRLRWRRFVGTDRPTTYSGPIATESAYAADVAAI